MTAPRPQDCRVLSAGKVTGRTTFVAGAVLPVDGVLPAPKPELP